MRPRGAVNVVSLTLLAAAVSAGYLAWIYVPLLLDDLDVEVALAAGAGQLTLEVSALDATGVQNLVAGRLAKVGTHWEDQEDGKRMEVPGLGVAPEDVQVERAPDGKSGKVTLDYARTVKLKPLEQFWTIHFHTQRESTLR